MYTLKAQKCSYVFYKIICIHVKKYHNSWGVKHYLCAGYSLKSNMWFFFFVSNRKVQCCWEVTLILFHRTFTQSMPPLHPYQWMKKCVMENISLTNCQSSHVFFFHFWKWLDSISQKKVQKKKKHHEITPLKYITPLHFWYNPVRFSIWFLYKMENNNHGHLHSSFLFLVSHACSQNGLNPLLLFIIYNLFFFFFCMHWHGKRIWRWVLKGKLLLTLK